MKNFIVFIIIIAFTSTTFSQDFCEGSIIVNGDTINVGWRGKDKNYGNVPTNIIPLSTGWIPYAPFTDEFDTFDSSKWTKTITRVIQCPHMRISLTVRKTYI